MIDRKIKYRIYQIIMGLIVYILVHCWLIFSNDVFMYIAAFLGIFFGLFYNPFAPDFWKCKKCGKIVYECPTGYCECKNLGS